MGVVVKSFFEPDETRSFPHGSTEMVTVGSTLLGRGRMEPGWRWSNDVKPIAGTEQCMVLHKGYCVAGALVVQADGKETRIKAGDGFVIEPVTMPGWTGTSLMSRSTSPSRWRSTRSLVTDSQLRAPTREIPGRQEEHEQPDDTG